jgi:probable F420-dependent oxidoreductase
MDRYGMTVPFDGVTLLEQRAWMEELSELGYTDVWSGETDGADGFTPLALVSVWAPALRLGVAIIPVFTRGPAVIAQSVAAMAEAAPGRFVIGLGTSSNVIVQGWNGIPFEDPYHRTADTVRFLRQALTGEKVDMVCRSFTVKGFRLSRVPDQTPLIFLAALRPGMLRLAGRLGDGAITNWLSAEDVTKVVPEVGEGKEVAARILVCPSENAEMVRQVGRRAIAAYLNVPVYAEFHRWLGRGPRLEGMWEAWRAGDRKAALAAIDDSVVDELIVHGSPEECRRHIQRYVDNGITTPILSIIPFGGDVLQAVRDLAPLRQAGTR